MLGTYRIKFLQQVTDNNDYLPQWTWLFHTACIQKIVTDWSPHVCSCCSFYSLAISLLCFITFLSLSVVQLRLSTPNSLWWWWWWLRLNYSTVETDFKVRRGVCEGQNRRERRRQQHGSTLLKLKGPRTEWSGDADRGGIARFLFDTGTHSQLRFDLVDRKGFLCFGREHSCGAHQYPFGQVRLTLRYSRDRSWAGFSATSIRISLGDVSSSHSSPAASACNSMTFWVIKY